MPLQTPPPPPPLLLLNKPISYLITSGETTPTKEAFTRLFAQVRAAVRARISLIQLREKSLSPCALYELTARAVELTRYSETRLLVNDRADIARAAGADGVHLSTRSLDTATVRRAFGEDFLIGVSTHSLLEARAARDGGANFAVFGPIFETPAKLAYGAPLGLERLRDAVRDLAPFPLLALGGINTLDHARQAMRFGAYGVAAIRFYSDTERLPEIVRVIEEIN